MDTTEFRLQLNKKIVLDQLIFCEIYFVCSNMRASGDGSWWRTRFDVDSTDREHMIGDSSDVDSDIADQDLDDDALERKSARFTLYSLSSSVVPRSEGT